MIDENADVRRTFNDYQEDSDISFVKLHIDEGHHYAGRALKDLMLPPHLLVVLIIRGKETIVPNGATILEPGDLLVAAGEEFEDRRDMTLQEITVTKSHRWVGCTLNKAVVPKGTLIVMIRRGKETIIPDGETVICEGDVLVRAKF